MRAHGISSANTTTTTTIAVVLPRVIRSYQKEGLEIVDLWHSANMKYGSKAKLKDDSDSSTSRRRGFSLPHTNSKRHLVVGVDDIQDLPDCPVNFESGKPFLPDIMIEGVPSDMQRMHSWYTRACTLGLSSIWAQYDPDIFGAEDKGVTNIMFNFEEIQNMFCLKELSIEMVRLWCM
jgi:hypothetical protein